MTDLRFPIGKAQLERDLTGARRRELIDQIAAAPENLRKAVLGLKEEQLDTEYRPGGWTVRQVVHHVPDSHLNSYIRFKLALTEDEPTIKPYDEAAWAELLEARTAPPEISLGLLDALHQRWVLLLREMSSGDYQRTLRHPEIGQLSLNEVLCIYAWHGRHHTAHITALRDRMGWN
ncbi:MAG TPA: putative metal-dependent hydrolase [Blastocatellia bacterium]|nr:putative metal-dependent hydrolase [Blastocatellia bacterium]